MKEPDLTELITTTSQAVDFTQRLTSISSEIYESDFNLEKSLQKNFGVSKKEKLLIILRENKVPLDSYSSLKKYFDHLKEVVSNMSEVTIITAVEPTQEILDSIANWFALNLKRQILVDPKIDSKLIGGAEVNYQGKLYDSSLKNEFDQLLNVNGENNSQQKQNKAHKPTPNET